MPRIAKRNAELPSNETRLIDAAIRCLERYGSAKTFIEDIAKEAGLSRQTAYRTFGTRQELFEKVVDRRLAGIAAIMQPRMTQYASFEETLVRGAVDSVRLAKGDPTFQATLEAAGYHGLDRILLKKGAVAFLHLEPLWHGVLATARAGNQIRRDLSDQDVLEYIRLMEIFLICREDLSESEQHDFLMKFMIPVITA